DHTADRSYRWRGPLSVQNFVEHGIVFPNEFAGLLVDGNDRRCFWGRNVDVALILPIRSADIDEIAVHDWRRIREVVRQRPYFLHHVKLPNYVGVCLACQLLVRHWSIVLFIAKTLGIET